MYQGQGQGQASDRVLLEPLCKFMSIKWRCSGLVFIYRFFGSFVVVDSAVCFIELFTLLCICHPIGKWMENLPHRQLSGGDVEVSLA